MVDWVTKMSYFPMNIVKNPMDLKLCTVEGEKFYEFPTLSNKDKLFDRFESMIVCIRVHQTFITTDEHINVTCCKVKIRFPVSFQSALKRRKD